MIITLIGVGLFVLGVVGVLVCCGENNLSYDAEEVVNLLSAVVIVVGGIWAFICVLFVIVAHCAVNKQIYDAGMRREALIRQIEAINTDYEDVSTAAVIQGVYDWNTDVYGAKYWGENPWTSWFWDKDYVESLEYIEWEE